MLYSFHLLQSRTEFRILYLITQLFFEHSFYIIAFDTHYRLYHHLFLLYQTLDANEIRLSDTVQLVSLIVSTPSPAWRLPPHSKGSLLCVTFAAYHDTTDIHTYMYTTMVVLSSARVSVQINKKACRTNAGQISLKLYLRRPSKINLVCCRYHNTASLPAHHSYRILCWDTLGYSWVELGTYSFA